MKQIFTASAIAVLLGLGAGSAANAAPVQTLGYSNGQVEVQQVGFKKFKRHRHFRGRGFGHRRFHRGRFFHRDFHGRKLRHDRVYKGGHVVKKHHDHGVVHKKVHKKKVITPFGIFFK